MECLIKLAFIKQEWGAGGTERWLQLMAEHLPRKLFKVDTFFGTAFPRFEKYDIIQTAGAGRLSAYFRRSPVAVVNTVTLLEGVEFAKPVIHTVLLSEWQRKKWVNRGGRKDESSVIPIPVQKPVENPGNLRDDLEITAGAVVAGFHQRGDDAIASDIPLRAFKALEDDGYYFIIMGGGKVYQKQAFELGLRNIRFVPYSSSWPDICRFLATLDIYAHGRKDGETFGACLAEALAHGLPCLSHRVKGGGNAQVETIGDAGYVAKNFVEYKIFLEQLFYYPNLRMGYGLAAKEQAKKYAIVPCVDKLSELYQKIMLADRSPEARGSYWSRRVRDFAYTLKERALPS
jgi:hypothetical protein